MADLSGCTRLIHRKECALRYRMLFSAQAA